MKYIIHRQMKLTKLLTLTLACILLFTVQARAEITPQLMQEWGRQPNNVQWNVYRQNANIQVVDVLPWESPDLAQTWAYTTLHVNNGYVTSLDIVIKRGYESTLTHEIGHAISDYKNMPYWWATNPAFYPIWQRERYNNVLLAQGWEDVREYFACAYDCYIRYPELLRRTCPDTYNYLTVVLHYT